MVYLFQRPESMQRAWDKARRDMRPGTWMVSLEFDVQGGARVCPYRDRRWSTGCGCTACRSSELGYGWRLPGPNPLAFPAQRECLSA